MDQVKFDIGTLALVVVDTDKGPLFENEGPGLPLGWVLNEAVLGEIPDFRAKIERGETAHVEGSYAARYNPRDGNLEALRARWRDLTGQEPAEDAMVVGTTFHPDDLLVPRTVILDLLTALEAIRRGAPSPPPAATAAPAPEPPAPRERQALEEVEQRARELDALAATPSPDPEILAAISAKRRVLLIDLDLAGLLSEDHATEKRRLLEAWSLSTLLGYFEAALQLHAYFRSAERRRALPAAAPGPVLGGPVSLDWFRLRVPTPADSTPHLFLAFCEQALSSHDLKGGGGQTFVRAGKWYRIVWRKDDAVHPSLLFAEDKGAKPW